jgi:hypothetical protein
MEKPIVKPGQIWVRRGSQTARLEIEAVREQRVIDGQTIYLVYERTFDTGQPSGRRGGAQSRSLVGVNDAHELCWASGSTERTSTVTADEWAGAPRQMQARGRYSNVVYEPGS